MVVQHRAGATGMLSLYPNLEVKLALAIFHNRRNSFYPTTRRLAAVRARYAKQGQEGM
jgi:hypothetical protein